MPVWTIRDLPSNAGALVNPITSILGNDGTFWNVNFSHQSFALITQIINIKTTAIFEVLLESYFDIVNFLQLDIVLRNIILNQRLSTN